MRQPSSGRDNISSPAWSRSVRQRGHAGQARRTVEGGRERHLEKGQPLFRSLGGLDGCRQPRLDAASQVHVQDASGCALVDGFRSGTKLDFRLLHIASGDCFPDFAHLGSNLALTSAVAVATHETLTVSLGSAFSVWHGAGGPKAVENKGQMEPWDGSLAAGVWRQAARISLYDGFSRSCPVVGRRPGSRIPSPPAR